MLSNSWIGRSTRSWEPLCQHQLHGTCCSCNWLLMRQRSWQSLYQALELKCELDHRALRLLSNGDRGCLSCQVTTHNHRHKQQVKHTAIAVRGSRTSGPLEQGEVINGLLYLWGKSETSPTGNRICITEWTTEQGTAGSLQFKLHRQVLALKLYIWHVE